MDNLEKTRFVLSAFAIFLCLVLVVGFAQIGINPNTPNPPAFPAVISAQPQANAGPDCASFPADRCPSSCTVCPPCEACSSISCNTETFCQSIGFNRSWYAQIQENLANAPQNKTIEPVVNQDVGSLTYVSSFENGTRYATQNGKFAVLDLHGSFREMGRQYGYLMRDEMQQAYKKTMFETAKMGMTPEQVDQSSEFLYQSNSEKYVELMQGMSETSGLSFQEQKRLNGGVISLIDAYIFKAMSEQNSTSSKLEQNATSPKPVQNATTLKQTACSGVAFWGNYSKDGKLYFGRNWDMVQSLLSPYLPYMTVAVYHPDSGNTVANLEWIGEVYTETAMNDQGLFLELNNGGHSDPGHYPGRVFAGTKLFDFMLDSSDMNDISREFNTTLASDSYLIQVADKNQAYSYEWPTFGANRRSENVSGLLVAYNDFVPPYPSEWEGKVRPANPADLRRSNFLSMANSPTYKGKMDVELMKQFLNVSFKDGGGKIPDNVYQVIAVPEDYKMYLHGQNYSGWEEVDLKPLFGK